MIKEILSRQRMPDYGYELRTELVKMNVEDEPMKMVNAYSLSGSYIGNPKTAYTICIKRGIKPETYTKEDRTCSIGFCKKENKWYGWSHRAMYGFTIGDKVEKGDCTASSGYTDEYIKEHPQKDLSLPVGFTSKTMDDARRMAIAFAESVS